MKQRIIIFSVLMVTLTIQAQRMDNVTTHSPYIKAVDEYVPAPGQFVNDVPEYEEGDDASAMVRKCTESLANNERHLVALGGWGGYITFHFDHSIANVKGERDIYIMGNAYQENRNLVLGGMNEAGIVMVSKDVNGNGLPDDPWYEISGSCDVDSVGKVIYDYEVTYRKNPMGDIPWTDNHGNTGTIDRVNAWHPQEYYPLWLPDGLTFRGTRLPDNMLDLSTRVDQSYSAYYYVLVGFRYGYADNMSNFTDPADAVAAFDLPGDIRRRRVEHHSSGQEGTPEIIRNHRLLLRWFLFQDCGSLAASLFFCPSVPLQCQSSSAFVARSNRASIFASGAGVTRETTTAASRPAAKPGMISYRPVPFRRASHRISTTAPTNMPATAPPKVSRRQNRLSSMVGPKAAPNTPQAFSTRPMMVPLFGLEATIRAITAMMMTTTRPAHSISLSEASLRNTGLYTSLAKAEAEASSWESAVDMDAASMAESSMPEISAGKMARVIWMNTVEESVISMMPREDITRPTAPAATDMVSMTSVQEMPMTLDLRSSFWERTDMKRMMMWGMPK